MSSPGFLPTLHLEKILQNHPAALRDIVFELRNLIAAAAPGATETLLWGGLSYFAADRGGPIKGAVCQIAVLRDHVRLAFVRGAFLPDPRKLLEGTGKYKRFVRILSYDTAPWDDLKNLISLSSRLDPHTLDIR